VGSHAAALRSQGASQELVDAVGTGNLKGVTLSEKDRTLLEFVKVLTLTPAQTRDEHVEAMRKAGWTDEQIWEAAFEVSAFSFFNRMADAYGLDYPSSGWLPPDRRAP
jgi:alkylhydroperoxidase family enzyme